MIPGSNVLSMALSILGKQCFQYFPFLSRTLNSIGSDGDLAAAPVPVTGSVQPVPRNLSAIRAGIRPLLSHGLVPNAFTDVDWRRASGDACTNCTADRSRRKLTGSRRMASRYHTANPPAGSYFANCSLSGGENFLPTQIELIAGLINFGSICCCFIFW